MGQMGQSREAFIEFDDDKTTPDYAFFHQDSPTFPQIQAFEIFCKKMTSQGVASLMKEYMEKVKVYTNHTRVAFDRNMNKNRYKDIYCADASRVTLKDGSYIHANHVKGPPLYLNFILTQGPMVATVTDFWKMVDQCKVTHIIMLCDTMELGKPKCEQYIPKKTGEELKLPGGYRITMSEWNGVPEQLIEKTTVTTKVLMSTGKGNIRKIRHHHFKAWPDKGTPSIADLMPLLKILKKARTNSMEHTTIVHCSAGIGRTGTLVAIEMCLHQLLGDPMRQLDLMEIAKKLRDQRPGSIQVELQYVMVAVAVLEWGRTFGYIRDHQSLQNLDKFIADFTTKAQATTPEGSAPPPAKGGVSPAPKGKTPPQTPPPIPASAPPPVAGLSCFVAPAPPSFVPPPPPVAAAPAGPPPMSIFAPVPASSSAPPAFPVPSKRTSGLMARNTPDPYGAPPMARPPVSYDAPAKLAAPPSLINQAASNRAPPLRTQLLPPGGTPSNWPN